MTSVGAKMIEFVAFLKHTKELIKDAAELQESLVHSLKGNKSAAKKSRKKLVEIRKKGVVYRKESIKHIDSLQKKVRPADKRYENVGAPDLRERKNKK